MPTRQGPVRRLPRDAHQAAETLCDLIDAWPAGVGAVLAEAGDAAVDDPRVDRLQRLVVDLEAVLYVGAEVLDNDVGVFDQPVEDLAAGLGLQVDRDRPLVAMEVLAVEAGPSRIPCCSGRMTWIT